jgi:hypothetical protein
VKSDRQSSSHPTTPVGRNTRNRPRAATVFAAAFLAGATAAVGVNRAYDLYREQAVPKVASVPVFVAIRSLPVGAPLTIYDIALKDWPVAMLPASALKADARLEDLIVKHPLREGQPVLSLQLTAAAAPPLANGHSTEAAAATNSRQDRSAAPAFVPYQTKPPVPLAATEHPVKTPALDTSASPTTTPENEGAPAPDTRPMVVPPDLVAMVEPATSAAPAVSEDVAAAVAAPMTPVAITTSPAVSGDETLDRPEDTTIATPQAVASVGNTPFPIAPEITPDPQSLATVEAPAAMTADGATITAETTADAGASQPVIATTPVDITSVVMAEVSAANEATAALPRESSPEAPPASGAGVDADSLSEATTLASQDDGSPEPSTPVPHAGDLPVMRYLVVPERIAVAADTSFVSTPSREPALAEPDQPLTLAQPPRTEATAEESRTSAETTHTATARSGVPPRTTAAAPTQSRPSVGRTHGPAAGAAADSRSPNVTSQTDRSPEERGPLLKSMFSNLSAGFTAVGKEWQQLRQGRSVEPGPAGRPRTSAPQQAPPVGRSTPASRAASRPSQAK